MRGERIEMDLLYEGRTWHLYSTDGGDSWVDREDHVMPYQRIQDEARTAYAHKHSLPAPKPFISTHGLSDHGEV